jgi:hypothetical protein
VLEYFALAVGSPYPGIAAAAFACAVAGAVALVRSSRTTAAVVLSFPAAYLAFFCLYPVMIPRNYLVLVPFFAVLVARGGATLLDRVPWRPVCAALGAAAVAALLANAAWLALAAASIRDHRDHPPLRPVLAWVRDHPDTRFAVSAGLRRALSRTALAGLPNVVDGPPWQADRAIFLASEQYARVLGARPGFRLTDTWFGPYEVNFDFYPSWLGSDRVVVMPSEHLPREPWLRPDQMPPQLRPGANP